MHTPMNELGLSSDNRREAQRIRVVDKEDPFFRSISTSRVAARDGVQEPCDVVLGSSKLAEKHIALTDCDELLSTGLCFYDEGEAAKFHPSWFAILKPMDVERWKCAATLFKENPPSGIWTEYDGLLNKHTSDWPPLSQRGATLGSSIWVLFVCAALVYGGLHALPWNSDFRTRHEKVLWRASVGVIMGFGPLAMAAYFVIVVLNRVTDKLDAQNELGINKSKSWWQEVPRESYFNILKHFEMESCNLFLWTLVGCLACLACLTYLALGAICLGYGLARIFIVVECFIALFNSVPGVFEVPSWSLYFPHIT